VIENARDSAHDLGLYGMKQLIREYWELVETGFSKHPLLALATDPPWSGRHNANPLAKCYSHAEVRVRFSRLQCLLYGSTPTVLRRLSAVPNASMDGAPLGLVPVCQSEEIG
jgi:hypothetical protein